MSDLISRAAAIEAIESHLRVGDEVYPLTRTDKILNHAFEIAASCVYNLPSAEVTLCHLDSPCEYQNADIAMPNAEKVGKWIIHPEVKNIYGGTYIECSECREKYVVQYIEDEKFCRNCGAKMRGEEG